MDGFEYKGSEGSLDIMVSRNNQLNQTKSQCEKSDSKVASAFNLNSC